MARHDYQFTSESVSEGHPDKVCDRISDEIVDLYFREGARAGLNPYGIRVACETLATTNRLIIAGEVRGPDLGAKAIEETARAAVKAIGYEQEGFHWRDAKVEVLLHKQSADIAQGVDAGGNKDEGAGDQGIMFGYACRETPELMPAPIQYAQKILRIISEARHAGREKALGPDAKSQVTVRYINGKPVEATQIVVSHQHLDPDLSSDGVAAIVRPYVVKALPEGWITPKTVWHVNPTGKFYIGGPDGDCGLTGRKIIVDTYGGAGAAPSPARIRPRSTARPPTLRAISPRTSSPRASPTAARCSSPTPSASPSRCQSTPICTGPATSTRASSNRR